MSTSARERAIRQELEAEQRLRPLELRRLFASFPEARALLLVLWGIINDADPTTSRTIGGNTRGGSDMYREIRQANRIGHYAQVISAVNRRLGALAREFSESPPKDATKGKRTHRKCRREGCELKNRRQPGIWTPEGKDPLCQWCRHPLPKGDAE